MKPLLLALSLSSSAIIYSACMTLNVNVNLPESAVQRATDDYVRELYRTKEKSKAPSPEEAKPAARFSLISEAWADSELFSVRSEKALKIRQNLASRLDEVLKYKREGVLGETNDGYVVIHKPEKLKKLLAKKVEKLVEDENQDRKALYDEVIVSNKLTENKLDTVRRSFARSFQAESPSGTWVQDGDGKWTQKP